MLLLECVNLIMALSNLAVLPVWKHGLDLGRYVAVMAASGSFLMHWAETKHGLPGLPPFNQHSYLWLNVDRATALFAFLFFSADLLVRYWSGLHHTVPWGKLYILAILGGASLIISEFPGFPLVVFGVFHLCWHFSAFYMMYLITVY